MSTLALIPDQCEKPAVQTYLPPGFILCNPEIGFDHCSLKLPAGHSILLHCIEMNDSFKTMYMLAHANIQSDDSPELYFITVRHHLVEGWYFADGVHLSISGSHATEFLLNTDYTRRSQSIEEMNSIVEKVVPKMLREKGISSVGLIKSLMKYTW